MRILVSACLLGVACRYDGKSKPHAAVLALQERHQLIPVCSEVFGGLPTPRTPAERVGDGVYTRDGCDVTAEYVRGAEEVLALAKRMDCHVALLKERGYRLKNAMAADLFPRCSHVESIVTMIRE